MCGRPRKNPPRVYDAAKGTIVADTGAGEPRLAEVLPDVGWPTGDGAMLPPGEMCMNGIVNPLL